MATTFIKPEEIESKLVEGKNTIIAVAASWCGPCNMMTQMVWDPINSEETDIQIFKIDVDDHKDWAKSQGVSGLPTMFIYDGVKKRTDTLVGFLPREQFEKTIKL